MTDKEEIYNIAEISEFMHDPNSAKLTINVNKVLDQNLVDGLHIDADEKKDGVDVSIKLDDDVKIERPVHLCFGVTDEKAIQKINMTADIGRNCRIDIIGHCLFPEAKDILHKMKAEILINNNSTYYYHERHVHSEEGGINVISRADVTLKENVRFNTDFELKQGRVGKVEIDYDTVCGRNSVMEMSAKISGRADDIIKISEKGHLKGDNSRGLLNTRIAVRDMARAEIYNKLIASGANARGHVECHEIIKDRATANAVPIVEVKNPTAHVTHEAAIGSVNSKQLQTLMSRGLTEDKAVELIINGLLK